MDMIVCIKQVPGTNKVEVDEKTGVLKREGVEGKMNPFDLFALEAALQLKERVGGSVSVLTMGPPQAEAVLREAFALGADRGYLMTDRRFAGADVLATSYTLSQGIRAVGAFDLILCGKQTTDGDTAQVGPAIAEYLEIPHVAWVSRIAGCDGSGIEVEQDLPDSVERVGMDYPCLITVEKGHWAPRLPSYRKKTERANWPIRRIGFDDLPDNDEGKYGLKGSPTQVQRIFPPPANAERVLHEDGAPAMADFLHGWLQERHFV